jgi:hypothetical protein
LKRKNVSTGVLEFQGVLVVIGRERFAVTLVRVDAPPGAFQYLSAESILYKFGYIVAVARLPAIGRPVFNIDFHVENITVTTISGKAFFF